jgi:hypothetical protein
MGKVLVSSIVTNTLIRVFGTIMPYIRFYMLTYQVLQQPQPSLGIIVLNTPVALQVYK